MLRDYSDNWEVHKVSLRLLTRYSLCDSCLGRAFAKLGHGHENRERGLALKLSLLLEIDRLIKDHELRDLEQVKELILNVGQVGEGLFRKYYSEKFQRRPCYLCGNLLDDIKQDFFRKSLHMLREKPVRYVLGVKLSSSISDLETKFVVDNGLLYYESMKNEIKREVGKMLSKEGFEPELDSPEVELIYDMESRAVITLRKNHKYLYYYVRLSRGIPISSWYSKGGESLEAEIQGKVMIPFSEPSDVRILTPYPLVVIGEEMSELNTRGYLLKRVKEVSKKEVSLLAQTKPESRVYRVTIYSREKVGREIYEGIQDLLFEAKDYRQLREKLSQLNVQVISVDVLEIKGKFERLRSYLSRAPK